MELKKLTTRTFKLSTLTAACLLAGVANAGVPHLFQNGNIASANQVNDNFRHLDERMDRLEREGDWRSTTVDCSSDSDALMKAIGEDYNEIHISGGECIARQIYKEGGKKLALSGSKENPATIRLDQNETSGFIFAKNAYFDIRDLKLIGKTPATYSGLVFADSNSFVRLTDVDMDCGGGEFALAARASTVRLDRTTIGGNCTGSPVFVSDGGYLRVNQDNQITNTGGPDTAAILALRGSSVVIRNSGGTNQIINNSDADESLALAIYHNSTVQVRGNREGAENIVKGSIRVAGSATASLNNFTWQPDNNGNKEMAAEFVSSIHTNDMSISGAELEVYDNSSLDFERSPVIENTSIMAEFGGTILIDHSTVADSSSITVGLQSSLAIEDSAIAADISIPNTGAGLIDSSSSFTGAANCTPMQTLWDKSSNTNLCAETGSSSSSSSSTSN